MSGSAPQAFQIRLAQETDAEALCDIFAPYVLEGTVSFDKAAPSPDVFREKIRHILEDYPFFLAETAGRPVGYCYASRFRAQAAYDWAVETSIYLDKVHHGQGIGRVLYEKLEETLTMQHIVSLYACISAAHQQSISFHSRMGYREIARFEAVAHKMGEWLDIVWMEKRLKPLPEKPASFIPFSLL